MTRTKVAKLLYLADVRAMETLGCRATALQWKWWHYGPYTQELLSLENELVALGALNREHGANYFGSREVRLSLGEVTPASGDRELVALVEDVVHELGAKAPTTLKNIAYDTVPMREAQAEGNQYAPLDLELVRRRPVIGKKVGRLRERLRSLAPQSTDDGADSALLEDIDAMSAPRFAANRRLLGQ